MNKKLLLGICLIGMALLSPLALGEITGGGPLVILEQESSGEVDIEGIRINNKTIAEIMAKPKFQPDYNYVTDCDAVFERGNDYWFQCMYHQIDKNMDAARVNMTIAIILMFITIFILIIRFFIWGIISDYKFFKRLGGGKK